MLVEHGIRFGSCWLFDNNTSTDSSLSVLCLFIDTDSSGKVHRNSINHYIIPKKYLSVKLLVYKDTQWEYAARAGGNVRAISPQTQHPLNAPGLLLLVL